MPSGNRGAKKANNNSNKKRLMSNMSVNGDLVQKPEWRLVFIERQRGIHIFLTKRKINIVVIMMDTVCWYERRIFRVRCESCVISRWQSEPPASSSVCVPRAYSLTLSTFATMATSSMRSCRGCFVVLRGGAALGDRMSAFCALHCTLV